MTENEPAVILFNSAHPDPDIRCLSNFHPCEVVDAGIRFKHLEGAFQAAKIDLQEDKLRFVDVSPQGAKKMGGARGKYKMDPERLRRWLDGERVQVMRRLVHEKFRHPPLREALLRSGDAQLVERLTRFPDDFWGTKKDGSGRNMLGQLLMEERARIRNDTTPPRVA